MAILSISSGWLALWIFQLPWLPGNFHFWVTELPQRPPVWRFSIPAVLLTSQTVNWKVWEKAGQSFNWWTQLIGRQVTVSWTRTKASKLLTNIFSVVSILWPVLYLVFCIWNFWLERNSVYQPTNNTFVLRSSPELAYFTYKTERIWSKCIIHSWGKKKKNNLVEVAQKWDALQHSFPFTHLSLHESYFSLKSKLTYIARIKKNKK